MYKYILLFIISSLLLAEDDLALLLSDYESKSELHKKTKDESAGHLIIYSRKDLDTMQAHILSDILKTIRFFNAQETQKGDLGLQRAGASCTGTSCIRMYINDQEMSSAVTGSALNIFAEYDLAHIDHIEVYLGGGALKFGNEYGMVTIKLYTKEQSREQGGFVATSLGSHGSYKAEVFDTGLVNDSVEYLLFANKKNENDQLYTNQNREIDRYTHSTNFYANFQKKDDYIVELSSYISEADALAGVGKSKTPDIANRNATYNYIALTKYFDDIKIKASYAYEKNGIENVDQSKIRLYDGSEVDSLDVMFENSIIKLAVEDTLEYKDHSLLIGIDFQKKDIDNINTTHVGVDAVDIYSAYAEYSYSFNDDNLLIAAIKWEQYDHKGYDRSDDYYQRRLGFVSFLNENLTFKAFHTHNYAYPELQQLIVFDRPIKGNPNLKPMEVHTSSMELLYKNNEHELGFMYMKMHIYDPIKAKPINGDISYFNQVTHAKFNDIAIDYTYRFDRDNKTALQYYYTNHNRPFTASPPSGGYVKLFNKIGRFDLYNELVYRESYMSVATNTFIDDGYDWTSSITYKVDEDFTVALKGKNLLNKAAQFPVSGLGAVRSSSKNVVAYAKWYF